MNKLIGVVIRHLPNHRPVVTAIIQSQKEYSSTPQCIHELIIQGKNHIDNFKKTYTEFTRANWYIDIVDNDQDRVIQTEEFLYNPLTRS